MSFEQINILLKRCNHFIGPELKPRLSVRKDGSKYLRGVKYLRNLAPSNVKPEGMGISAHNHYLMQDKDDTYLENMCWFSSIAESFNRYIDSHKIADDINAKRCLKWFRRQMWIDAKHVQQLKEIHEEAA